MYARAPLSVRELAFACQFRATATHNAPPPLSHDENIEGFRKDLLLYGRLLKIREDDIVTSFHPSVKDFLITQSKERESLYKQFLVQPGPAQQEISIACL